MNEVSSSTMLEFDVDERFFVLGHKKVIKEPLDLLFLFFCKCFS